jgi:hypothetical protein
MAAVAENQGMTVSELDALFSQNNRGSDAASVASSPILAASSAVSRIIKSLFAFLAILLKTVVLPITKTIAKPRRAALLLLFIAVPAYLMSCQSNLEFYSLSTPSLKSLNKRCCDLPAIPTRQRSLKYDSVYTSTLPIRSISPAPARQLITSRHLTSFSESIKVVPLTKQHIAVSYRPSASPLFRRVWKTTVLGVSAENISLDIAKPSSIVFTSLPNAAAGPCKLTLTVSRDDVSAKVSRSGSSGPSDRDVDDIAASCGKSLALLGRKTQSDAAMANEVRTSVAESNALRKQKNNKKVRELEEMSNKRTRRWGDKGRQGGGTWRPSGEMMSQYNFKR